MPHVPILASDSWRKGSSVTFVRSVMWIWKGYGQATGYVRVLLCVPFRFLYWWLDDRKYIHPIKSH